MPTVKMVARSKLHPAPWNPRTITDARFRNLCASIESDPDFLQLRPILATPDGTIYGGNMRFRALEHLGWDKVPVIYDDIPEAQAKERAIRDNNQWGEWQESDLAAILGEVQEKGRDISLLGFDPRKVDQVFAGINKNGVQLVDEVLVDQSIQLVPQNDYIVILCTTADDFTKLREALKLRTVRRGGYKKGSAFDATGTERVIPAKRLLGLLRAADADSDSE